MSRIVPSHLKAGDRIRGAGEVVTVAAPAEIDGAQYVRVHYRNSRGATLYRWFPVDTPVEVLERRDTLLG